MYMRPLMDESLLYLILGSGPMGTRRNPPVSFMIAFYEIRIHVDSRSTTYPLVWGPSYLRWRISQLGPSHVARATDFPWVQFSQIIVFLPLTGYYFIGCGNETKEMKMVRTSCRCPFYYLPEWIGTRIIQIEYQNSSSTEDEVWILLTRHASDTQRTCDFIALQVEMEEDIWLNASAQMQQSLSSKVWVLTSKSPLADDLRRALTRTALTFW